MKTIITLAVTVLVLNACFRAGTATWRYYEFKDLVQQEARFRTEGPVARLQEHVLKLAEREGLVVYPADVEVQRDGTETTISVAYLDQIEIVPRLYTREHLFEFEVRVNSLRPLAPSGSR